MSKSDDFKLSAVKLYLKIGSIRKVSELLECSKSLLHRWIKKYFESKSVSRKEYHRESIITDKLLSYITKLITKNPAIILSKIKKKINKFDCFTEGGVCAPLSVLKVLRNANPQILNSNLQNITKRYTYNIAKERQKWIDMHEFTIDIKF